MRNLLPSNSISCGNRLANANDARERPHKCGHYEQVLVVTRFIGSKRPRASDIRDQVMTVESLLRLHAMAAIVLVTALLFDAILRRRQVLTTAALWNAVLLALVVLPAASLLEPRWHLDLWPE